MISLLSALVLAATNFFPNPGFETWGTETGFPTDEKGRWRVQQTGEKGFADMSESAAEKHSGAFSLHLKDTNAGPYNHVLTCYLGSGCAKAARGRLLYASCWAKVVSAPNEKFLNISLSAGQGASKKGATAAASPAVFGTNGWVRIATKIRVPDDANSVSLNFNCANGYGNTGEAYFDDVVVSLDPNEHRADMSGYVPANERPLHFLSYHAPTNDTPEEAAYRQGYRHQPPTAYDGQVRPVISNGTFYVNGQPQFYLGVWLYNRTRIDWPSNPLGIDHIAYREPPGKKVFDEMGFNSSQISAAHAQIGAAVRGLPLLKPKKHWDKRDWKADEADIAAFFRRFESTPLVLDFAFGYHGSYPKDLQAQLNQKMGSWHAFIPFCPECPEGDRYYTAYFLGGTRAALRNGCNVFIYELFNESSYGCACRYNVEAFAAAMKSRFAGDIAAANARWGTIFADWTELLCQSDYEQYPGVWYDWCRFLGERYADVLRHYQKVIRHADRRQNVYFTEQEAGTPCTKPTMDYRKVADALDVLAIEGGWQYGFKTSFNAANEMEGVVATGGSAHFYNCDWFRALARGRKPIIDDEHYCTRLENAERVPSKRSDYITSLWLEAMHGVSASYFYVWDKRSWEARTPEQAHDNVRKPSYKSSSLLNPYNVRPEDLAAFKEFRNEFDPFRELVMPEPRVKPAKVGVVFVKASEIQKGNLPRVKPSRKIPHYVNARDLIMGDWYAAILHALYPVRVVFAEDLSADSQGLDALVFPNAPCIEPAALEAARAFAAHGGLVLAGEDAFARNECFQPLQADTSFVTRVRDVSAALDALAKRGIAKYAALEPTEGAPFAGADVQICDRGAKKLVCLVEMKTPASRSARLKLFLDSAETANRYCVKNVVTNQVLPPPEGASSWSVASLAAGIPLEVPSQERVILLLERQ